MGRSALQCLMLGLVALLLISTRAQAAFWDQSPGEATGKENQAYSQSLVRFDNVSSHYGKEKKAKYEPDKILVKYKPGVSEADKEKQHKKHGSTKIKALKPLNIHHLKLKKGLSVEEAIKLYQADPNVAFAEPDYIVSVATVTPNDTYYGSSGSWGQPYQDMWGLHKMNLGEAWSVTQGSSEVIVAVSDTGLDLSHPDIQANLWINPSESTYNGIDDDSNSFVDDRHGWNWVAGNNNPADDHGHGTHVSGTIAAATNNGIGVAGISWNAKIMALKFLAPNGSGSSANGAATIIYAADKGAKVVNCSWGSSAPSQTVEDAVNYAFSRGVVVVAAAGNYNEESAAYYPGGYDNVITVAATDPTDAKASFSNYGDAVEVSAPGVDILSLRAGTTDIYMDGVHIVGTKYYRADGTSMAAPHVSGLAALLFSQYPAWSNVQVMAQIVGSTDEIGNASLGSGRINALSALSQSTARQRVVYQGRSIADQGGNADGRLDAGESADVVVTVKNFAAPADATVTLSSSDPYVTVTSATAAYGTIGSWQSANNSAAPFQVSVSAEAPPLHRIPFTVTVTANGGSYTQSFSFEESIPSEVPGWPVQTGAKVSAPVALADLDGDGISEVVTYSDQIYVLRGDGTPLPGWPQPLPYDLNRSQVAVGDLEGNGEPVVVIAGQHNLYAWNRDGSMREGFPVEISETLGYLGVYNTSLADLDRDGLLEIVTMAHRLGKVYVWRHDGTPAPGWPVSVPPTDSVMLPKTQAVGDIDGDGYPEVLVATEQNQNRVYAWHHDGTPVAGWPISMPDSPMWVVVADTGNDGTAKVFVSTAAYFLYGFNGDGSPLPGWGVPSLRPSFGDLNGDGVLEVVAAGNGDVFVYNGDGVLLPGWPQQYVGYASSPAILGDVDGDGGVDILIRSEAGIYGWHADGTPLAEFPFKVSGQDDEGGDTLALGDINGDAFIDLVTGSGPSDNNIYAFQLPGPYVPRLLPWPMYQRDPARTSELVHTPVIVSSALSGVLTVPLSQKLVARGGYAPYSWRLIGGALPPGLSFNVATGEVSGVPTAAGSFAFTVELADANGALVTKTINAQIEPIAIMTGSLAPGTIGASYTQSLAAAGGTPPYSWSVLAGPLPGGLAFDPATGVITGYPTASGSFALTFQVSDAQGAQATRALTLEVTAWADKIYQETYPHSITVDQAGNLYLAGVRLSPYQLIAAKYGPAGNLIWERTLSGEQATNIAVDGAGNVYLAGYSLSGANQGFLVKYDPAGTLLWTRSRDDSMTANLGVDAAGNVYFSGRPPAYGSAPNFLVKYDAAGTLQWEKEPTYSGSGGMAFDSEGNLYCNFGGQVVKYDPSGTQLWDRGYAPGQGGFALDQDGNVLIGGGYQVKKFDSAGNKLWSRELEGVELAGAGMDGSGNFYVTGTSVTGPTRDLVTMKYDAAGTLIWSKTYDSGSDDFAEAVAVDQNGNGLYVAGATDGITLVLLRYVQPRITTTALPEGTVGQPYLYQLSASHGATPYNWTAAPGTLPAGLALDPSTGVISGTPLSSGVYSVTVRASGAIGASDLKTLVLTVHPSPTASPAEFSAAPLVGEAPLVVNFTDASGNSPFAWSWLFGDGGSSNDRNPSHLYSTPGTYAVSLTAVGATGFESVTKPGYITILACSKLPVKRWGHGEATFADINAAYGSAQEYDLIQLLGVEQSGAMLFDKEISVELRGGYDCGYGSRPGVTQLAGSLKVMRGTVLLDNVKFK